MLFARLYRTRAGERRELDAVLAAEPRFFSKEWADAVRDALVAGPSEQARAGKLQAYWDFFELIKSMYPASWALGCRDLPAELGDGAAYLFVQWGARTALAAR